MTWLRIDDGFTEHRKLLNLKRADRWTWMEVMTYCARQNDGGNVPAGISDILRYATPAFLSKCMDAGLLDQDGSDYRVHDWLEYNPKDPTNATRQQRYRNGRSNGEVTEIVTDEIVTTVTPPRARVPSPSRPLKEQPLLPSTSVAGQGRTEGGNLNLEQVLKDIG